MEPPKEKKPTILERFERRIYRERAGRLAAEEKRREDEKNARLKEVQEALERPPSDIDEPTQPSQLTQPSPPRRTSIEGGLQQQSPTSPQRETHSHPTRPTKPSLLSSSAIQALRNELEEVKNKVQELTRQRDESDGHIKSLLALVYDAEKERNLAITDASPTEATLRTQVVTLSKELEESRQRRKDCDDKIEQGLTRERELKDQLKDQIEQGEKQQRQPKDQIEQGGKQQGEPKGQIERKKRKKRKKKKTWWKCWE
jgi:hypothetical protein